MFHAMLNALQDAAAIADPAAAKNYMSLLGAGIGIGLTVLGAGIGIGKIGDSAAQATARQPEMHGNIQTTSLILAALIEGVALFGLVLALLFKLLD